MKNILLLIVSMVSLSLNAQYYYNDIMGTQDINNKMKTYLAAKVRSATATGYDELGNKTADFNEWQDVQANNSILKITTRNGQNVARTYYQFDNNTRLINARDSSTDAENVTTYTYDANNNLVNIRTTLKDALHDFDQTTERQWNYKEGKPSKLLLIVNGTDSMEYSFTIDEHKNVVDEMMTHRGGTRNKLDYAYDPKKIYYFYDEQNRLTDITKYNETANGLLPDYMFTYDDKNQVIQKITVLSTVQMKYGLKKPDYFIWRYGFDEKGLKTKEVLYGKEKELKGKIEYSYTFGQ
jgi:YD repeat-containing protein